MKSSEKITLIENEEIASNSKNTGQILNIFFSDIVTILIFSTITNVRSSHPHVFCQKGVLKNFAKFKEKLLCQSLFFNKVASLRTATSLKKETLPQVFSFEFLKILKNNFFYRTF